MRISTGGWTLAYDGQTYPITSISWPEWREVVRADRNWVPFGSLRAMLLTTVANVVAHSL